MAARGDYRCGASADSIRPITDIGDPGQIALIQDSEGNIVGLHQPPAAQRH